MQLVSIWFAVASLVTMVASLFVKSPLTQLLIFVIVSFVLLIFTRPLLKKTVVKEYHPTNYDLDVGKVATVIETIENSTNSGRVSLNGVDWNANSTDGATIEKGSQVVVEDVKGSKLLVKKL
jgi:membrane protein implicated in regulation of membrane protease activity